MEEHSPPKFMSEELQEGFGIDKRDRAETAVAYKSAMPIGVGGGSTKTGREEAVSDRL